jgi:hypothetical protein
MATPESFLGTQPSYYIAYAPRGPGLECAVAYFVDGRDVYGWFIGFRAYRYPAAYFKLENYFSAGDTVFYATEGSDVYGGWRHVYSSGVRVLEESLRVEDRVCHQLDQLQDGFVEEWLWLRGAAGSEAEAQAYERDELAVGEVNLQHKHLGKLHKDAAVWTYQSHGLDVGIIQYLRARWPLDYGKDLG